MKLSKKIAAVLAAALMTVTMFTGAMPASAKSASSSLKCGNYTASVSLVSANKYSGMAVTSSSSKDSSGNTVKFNTLCAAMFGTKVDKNGDNPKYVSSNGTPKTNATYTAEGIPVLSSTGGYYYAKMASAHIAIKNGVEKATTLNVAY